MENIKFSVVEKFSLTNKICSEEKLINGIKGERMKLLVEPIRKLMDEGEHEKASLLKNNLPAIIPTGIFKGGRTADKLQTYSNIICLDLDNLSNDKVVPVKDIIAGSDFTLAVFLSPRGNGLKILVKVNTGSNYHKEAYSQVVKYYSRLTKEKFDEKTNDVARLMFMSYDPDVYHYPDSEIFQVVTPIIISKPIFTSKLSSGGTVDKYLFDKIYKKALRLTEAKQEYKQSNRNNFIYHLINICNRYGLPLDELRKKIEWCDLPAGELKNTISRVYNNKEQYGTWQLDSINENSDGKQKAEETAKDAQENTTADSNSSVTEMNEKTGAACPTLPTEVYDFLPDFLKRITGHFASGSERDLVLLSSLGVISSAFPNTRGVYARSFKALNLFELFVAPASSGKGQMKWSEILGKGIDEYLRKKYKKEYAIFKKADENSKPVLPVEKKFYIGSDSSNIALASQMYRNENIGVMYDSEGSTLAQMFKNDWSNSRNILLKAFENESQSINRKSWEECFTIQRCTLSVVLSTTTNQLAKIIGSIESGLYSRFLIYYFSGEIVWKDFFSLEGDSLEPVFEVAAQELLVMYKANEAGPISTIFLSDQQKAEIFLYFSARLQEFHKEYDDQLLANVRRTCVIYYKIAMILTTMRAYQKMTVLPEKFILDDNDHRAAFLIVDTLLEHVKIVYETAMQDQTEGIIGKKKLLLKSLPKEDFQKSTYIEISKTLGIKKPTAEKYLSDLQKSGNVIKLDHGLYRKAA